MSNTLNHTPGPWTQRPSRRPDEIYIEGPHGNSSWIVAEVAGRHVEENKANAHLIAASPDLLAVCMRIIAEHESDGEISIGCIEDARAAVKKATQPDEET